MGGSVQFYYFFIFALVLEIMSTWDDSAPHNLHPVSTQEVWFRNTLQCEGCKSWQSRWKYNEFNFYAEAC